MTAPIEVMYKVSVQDLYEIKVPVTRLGPDPCVLDCDRDALQRAAQQLTRLLNKHTKASARRMSPRRRAAGHSYVAKICLVETLLGRMPENKIARHLEMDYLEDICHRTSELYRRRLKGEDV